MSVIPYLGIPSGSGLLDYRTAAAMEQFRVAFPASARRVQVCSLLAYAFNTLYADALNLRGQGLTHFFLLHDDVGPTDPTWATRMVGVLQEQGLGALSLTVPIRGTCETSTAIDAANPNDSPRRFSVAQTGEWPDGLLTSRQQPGLLINSGCLLIDLRQSWSERLYFHVKDGIRRTAEGVFEPWVAPEDWELSRMLRRLGVAYGAFSAIPLTHAGRTAWQNQP